PQALPYRTPPVHPCEEYPTRDAPSRSPALRQSRLSTSRAYPKVNRPHTRTRPLQPPPKSPAESPRITPSAQFHGLKSSTRLAAILPLSGFPAFVQKSAFLRQCYLGKVRERVLKIFL